MLCITLLLTQLAGSFVLITAVTESLLRRLYDESGELREEDEESDESVESGESEESDNSSDSDESHDSSESDELC